MSVLLDLAYLVATLIASPWIVYRLIARGDRQGVLARFGVGRGESLSRSIWLHGSSAGEIALLGPLVELLEERQVGNPLVISAYSATGLAAARKAFPSRRVIFFPFDLSFVVKRFLKSYDPCLIVIVESEFWPNFLLAADRREIPVAIINGKMSARSYRFHARTRLVPMLLRRLSLVAVQTPAYEQRLLALGVPPDRLRVTGNMKYDLARPPERRERARELRRQMGYRNEDVVIIAGSVHELEDEALIAAFARLVAEHSEACLVITPRYPKDAARIEQLAAQHGFTTVRKTRIDSEGVPAPGASGILVIDTVGELRALYGLADIAFVGGSLFFRGSNKGGHNLMEPAIVGLPVVFGPYHHSFEDTARELIAAGAGFEAHDVNELGEILLRLLTDAPMRRASGRRAEDVILEGQGATKKNFELLMPLIQAANRRLPAPGLSPTMPPAVSDVD